MHGDVPKPLGSAHRLAAPYQALRTEDGYLTIGAGTDKLWERLIETIDRLDLLSDERFRTNADRVAHRAELEEELESTFTKAPTAEWVERLVAAGMPAGPIFDYGQVLEDEHTAASGMVVECDHPVAGRVRMLGTPFRTQHRAAAAAPGADCSDSTPSRCSRSSASTASGSSGCRRAA